MAKPKNTISRSFVKPYIPSKKNINRIRRFNHFKNTHHSLISDLFKKIKIKKK